MGNGKFLIYRPSRWAYIAGLETETKKSQTAMASTGRMWRSWGYARKEGEQSTESCTG